MQGLSVRRWRPEQRVRWCSWFGPCLVNAKGLLEDGKEFQLELEQRLRNVDADTSRLAHALEDLALRLEDENIINLTKDFSLYGYQSIYSEERKGISKVTWA